jgi:sugar phosphate isomerase/epimerase
MANPKIGLSMLYCLGQPFNEMIVQIEKAEIPNIELVDDGLHALNRKRVHVLNELAASYGLKYTVHAPFISVDISTPSDWLLKAMIKGLEKSIVNSSALNCQVWVFHPGLKSVMSNLSPGMNWVRNLKSASLLTKFARDQGVTAAIENVPEPFLFVMKTVEDFRRFYNEIDEDISMTLDLGHANISHQTDTFLTTFADKIVHIHAHDNDGKSDSHLGIGSGTIDWERTADLIKKISHDKIIVVESTEHIQESLNRLRLLFA